MANLFDIAEQNGISIFYSDIPRCSSMSVDQHICMDFSYILDCPEANVHLAHEMGHCMTGSFYNRHTPFDIRRKHENRANKWAIKRLVPLDELKKALSNGVIQIWELAEYFNVTEDFIKKALDFYQAESRAARAVH